MISLKLRRCVQDNAARACAARCRNALWGGSLRVLGMRRGLVLSVDGGILCEQSVLVDTGLLLVRRAIVMRGRVLKYQLRLIRAGVREKKQHPPQTPM